MSMSMSASTFHSYPFAKLPSHPTPSPSFPFAFACALSPKTPYLRPVPSLTIPARDRVIDFGKHKGKMLGTLPSSYLKWVSKNLRARDFEEWATLADQVLQDPIYQDRIQWELGQNILSGDKPTSSTTTRIRNESGGIVSELLELSERFGWDNEDKSGWKNVNFELLGTSKGGRIPRISRNDGRERSESKTEEMEKTEAVSEGGGNGRRRERRDRQRLRTERERKGVEGKEEEELKWMTSNWKGEGICCGRDAEIHFLGVKLCCRMC